MSFYLYLSVVPCEEFSNFVNADEEDLNPTLKNLLQQRTYMLKNQTKNTININKDIYRKLDKVNQLKKKLRQIIKNKKNTQKLYNTNGVITIDNNNNE